MTDEAADLFGKPPLMKGEDMGRYNRLLAAVEHQIKPKTVFQKMLVREWTDKFWEQQRSKDSVAALAETAYIEALASLLRPFLARPMMSIDQDDTATQMARDYHNGEAKAKKVEEIELRLAQYGISVEQIRAKAMQLCGSGIAMFNRIGTNCETSLRILRKEIERNAATSAEPEEVE